MAGANTQKIGGIYKTVFEQYVAEQTLNKFPLKKLYKWERAEYAGQEVVYNAHVTRNISPMWTGEDGAFGEAADIATQRAFFDAHIGSWAGRFFGNLETSPNAKFYRPVGTIGKLFMEIESRSFAMAA